MCKCNRMVRTPFCGAPGCEWPAQIPRAKPLIDIEAIRASVALKRKLPPEMLGQSTQHVIALLDEVERLRAALTRAHAELDDILEDWQLEGRHGQPRYERLKRETKAADSALRGAEPQEAKHER